MNIPYMLFTSALIAVNLLLTSCNNPDRDFKKAEAANTEQAYNEFIRKHPKSPMVIQAKAHIEKNAFEDAHKVASVEAYEGFLKRFSSGVLAQHAKAEMEALEFNQAVTSATIVAWESFLSKYSQSTNTPQARHELAHLVFLQVATTNAISSYQDFIKRFPETDLAKEAMKRIEILDYQAATNINDISAYEGFLTNHPNSEFIIDINKRLNAQLEEGAWNKALLENSADAFLAFNTTYPNNNRVEVVRGTLNTSFEYMLSDSLALNPMVRVTIKDGGRVLLDKDITQKDAIQLKAVDFKPLEPGGELGVIKPIGPIQGTVVLLKQTNSSAKKTSAKIVGIIHGEKSGEKE